MFFKKRTNTRKSSTTAEPLEQVVQQELGEADNDTMRIVTAIAGLLASVAYADRQVTKEEERALADELSRIHGLSESGVGAIQRSLTQHIVQLSTLERPRYTRALLELADRDLRVQVLGVLVDLAAADGTISVEEVTTLRGITTALGLDQSDYNSLQAAHRDKLASLK